VARAAEYRDRVVLRQSAFEGNKMSGARSFGETDTAILLDAMNVFRAALLGARRAAPVGEAVYKETGTVMDAIDDLAGVLIGDREYFHLPTADSSGDNGEEA
jgi:hypothetical protein